MLVIIPGAPSPDPESLETKMAWYAYCIIEHSTFPQGRVRRPFSIDSLKGIADNPVKGFPSGEFVVVVSELPDDAQLTQQAILEHARVVSDCFRLATVLPFRFGTMFPTDEALRQAVRSNRRAFSESIARLRGKAEMRIRVMLHEDGPLPEVLLKGLPEKAGGEYLSWLRIKATRDRERQTRARALSVQVHKLFNPLQEEVSCKKIEQGVTIEIAHLIDTAGVAKYQNRYSSAMRQFKNCNMRFSGPWPPYHFMPDKLRTVGGNS